MLTAEELKLMQGPWLAFVERGERPDLQNGPGNGDGPRWARRYWVPALLSSELPEPDCPPVQVRLLGEDLVGFRDTKGRVGIVQWWCPHRGTPLWMGRNEEEGLRCLYHGWKFDVSGRCCGTR